MYYTTELERWQHQRHTHLESVEYWLSCAENRHELRDPKRYQRVLRDLDEAQRLHALIRPHEHFPNDRTIPRLRAELACYAPAARVAGTGHDITDADLKAAGLALSAPRTRRRRITRTRPFTCSPEKRQWLIEHFGEGIMCPGRSVRMTRAGGEIVALA